LRDNEALVGAVREFDRVLPVYVIDPREWGFSSHGFRRTGVFRTRFLGECVESLREGLMERGGDLLVVEGWPEVVLPELITRHGAEALFASREVGWEEAELERRLVDALGDGSKVRWFRGQTLLHPEDLPFELDALPSVFTVFRRRVEAGWVVRQELPVPERVPWPERVERCVAGCFERYGAGEVEDDERAVLRFRGGEPAGLGRLESYFWEGDRLRSYKETRNGLVGPEYSSKFSPWLAMGCLSPRTVYSEVLRYEAERVKNDSTYWLVFELLWRDYFRFLLEKAGRRLFWAGGLRGRAGGGERDAEVVTRWLEGRTGQPFVDAGMRELRLTGYLSNRMRQNVASYFVHDLGQDWRVGAEWFESMLVDYDVSSNWGNWAYLAGVGTDPREGRRFNVVGQAERYDPVGEYRKLWAER
jgi:deoxyribodipyrimidine photo-lyase